MILSWSFNSNYHSNLIVSIGRRTIKEDNTKKYTKPIQFTPQTSSADSTSKTDPNSIELQQNNVPNIRQAPAKSSMSTNLPPMRIQKIQNNRHAHLSAFCNKSLQPNKYANFIIAEMGAADINSFQILQSSAAKQRIFLNITYSMIRNETYVLSLKCFFFLSNSVRV